LFVQIVDAQLSEKNQIILDSLIHEFEIAETDTNLCIANHRLGKFHFSKSRDLVKASTNLFKALEIAQKNNYTEIEAVTYDVMAWMEDRKGNSLKAVQYMRKACDYYRTTDKKTFVFKADYNLGCMLQSAGKLDESKPYLEKAVENAKGSGINNWVLNSLMALGDLYHTMGDNEKALEITLESAVAISKKSGKYGNGRIPNNLAGIYADLGDFANANHWMEEAFICAERKQDKMIFKELYFSDFKLKKRQGLAKEALESYELYNLYNDSILSNDVLVSSAEVESNFLNSLKELEVEKADAEKKLFAAEKTLLESEQKRTEEKSKWVMLIMLFAVLGLVIMVQRFWVSSKQKKIIQAQKEQVSEKNQEITDSITYAKRIQGAILPSDKLIKESLPESFVFYLPKDIVAGDFYWLEKVGSKVLFAAADCTGHGVPGAMVSVVCNNALNRSVREYGLADPGQILNKTRSIVIEEFSKATEEIKDGMDISLCSLNTETAKLNWSGANNPLWIIKKDSEEILEIKPNKEPIGKYDHKTDFVNHVVQLGKGDTIYLFTDGFADQFGGGKGKKLKSKSFKKMLLSIQDLPLQKQSDYLLEQFEKWKGNIEQIDDVCVIGVKI